MINQSLIKSLKHRLCLAALLAATSIGASAADLKLIANPSVGPASISTEELKAVFLATKSTLSDGSHVEPVLGKGGPVHEAFVKTILGKSEAALETYYRSLVFTGKGSMPRKFASDAEVIAYVSKTKGAVGYVSPGAAATGVKTLDIK